MGNPPRVKGLSQAGEILVERVNKLALQDGRPLGNVVYIAMENNNSNTVIELCLLLCNHQYLAYMIAKYFKYQFTSKITHRFLTNYAHTNRTKVVPHSNRTEILLRPDWSKTNHLLRRLICTSALFKNHESYDECTGKDKP